MSPRIAAALIAAALTATPLVAAPPAPPAPPAAGAKPATRPLADPKSAETLVKQGQDALIARDYKAAYASFLDASFADPRNVRAVHGIALTQIFLNDFPRAGTFMERALTMSAGKPDRALVLNNANLQIAMNNPMRAIKFLKDYIDAHPKDADEPVLNALGSALFLADDSARRNTLWQMGQDLYLKNQKAIEALPENKGKKRWGVEWLPAGEVDKKFAELRKLDQAVAKIGEQTDKAEARVITAKQRLRRVQILYRNGNANQIEVNVAQNNLATALTEFQRLAKEYDAANEKIVRPTFPRVLTPVALDDVTPPAAGATSTAALTMEDPIYKEAIAKATQQWAPKRAESEPDEKSAKPATPSAAPAAPPVAVVAIKSDKAAKVRVTQYAAAFAVAEDLVITAAAPLENAVEFELQTIEGAPLKATLVRTDTKSNLALLKLSAGGTRRLSYLTLADSVPAGAVACVAIPSVNLFNPVAEALGGTVTAPKEGAAWTVRLARHPRLMASPLVAGGKVVGVVMAGRDAAIDSLPATPVDAIKSFLGAEAGPAGGPYVARDPAAALLQLVATREVENK